MQIFPFAEIYLAEFAGLHQAAQQLDFVAEPVVLQQHVETAAFGGRLRQPAPVGHRGGGGHLGNDPDSLFQGQGGLLGVQRVRGGEDDHVEAVTQEAFVIGVGRGIEAGSGALGGLGGDVTHRDDLPGLEGSQVAGMAQAAAVPYLVSSGADQAEAQRCTSHGTPPR